MALFLLEGELGTNNPKTIEAIMKRLTKIMLFVGAVAFSVSLLADSKSGSSGTDILHYAVTKAMVNDGVESSAVGTVHAHQNQQGTADNQRLNISLSGLTASTAYELLAYGDTNLSDGIPFTTDTNGNALLEYRGQGNSHGLGNGKSPLPGILNPVSFVDRLDVFNTSGQAVLTADMTTPDRLQYLIKRDLSTSTVGASLSIEATTGHTLFELKASGLNPTSNYLLVVNDVVVQTNTTDSNGNLDITSLAYSGGILNARALELWDASDNLVLATFLP